MWELIQRLWKDALFLLSTVTTGGAAWESAGGAPTWVNIVTVLSAALATAFAVTKVRDNGE